MKTQVWRILLSGTNTGAANMGVDAAIFSAVEAGSSPPTLRLYGWKPYCVSLGYFQKPDEELNAEALYALGWDFVIRPTGGRAVLHAQELTYSLACKLDEVDWCSTLASSHARISKAWAQALSDFGLGVEMGQPTVKPERGKVSLPCFASTSRDELAFAGRKVVGSAQRRTRKAFLQHGSIPLTPEHERLVEVLPLTSEQRHAHQHVLQEHAISLSEIGTVPENQALWTQTLAQVLCENLGVDFSFEVLTAEEAQVAHDLEQVHRQRQELFLTHA